ncbi:unnamed protein product [Arabidopsis thaliana]|uniref:Uncharacterized protein n=1 Tax=Arabidopsis thaliana TaxID=3702 RepID=A0A654FDS0_ARATH|nr:unnamed protein product [Arabidopsis thaliana]
MQKSSLRKSKQRRSSRPEKLRKRPCWLRREDIDQPLWRRELDTFAASYGSLFFCEPLLNFNLSLCSSLPPRACLRYVRRQHS